MSRSQLLGAATLAGKTIRFTHAAPRCRRHKETFPFRAVGKATKRLGQRLLSTFLLASPGLGEKSLFGDAKQPPCPAVRQIEDVLKAGFERSNHARHGPGDGEAEIAEMSESLFQGRLGIQAGVDRRKTIRWIPTCSSSLA